MSRSAFGRFLFCASMTCAWGYVAIPDAAACGGTFCDAGPQVMPVDQRGENILFVVDGDTVEAHVQIEYTGDPEKFAWIVPVMAQPEVEAGSDPLFQSLLAGTVPTFTLSSRFEPCDDGRPTIGCADEGSALSGLDRGVQESADSDDPEVLDRGIAGAFEYAVLSGGTVEGVVQWLDDNEYAQDDEAPEVLAEYLAEDFMFVAFKLRGGTQTDEIHPVVIRYEGEPCIPIRLTRIAAEPDMGIRVFFLGDRRVAPLNFRSVEINPLLVDWINLGANYAELVTLAVDVPGSDGHGFVTEYAGPSSIVPTDGMLEPSWQAERFVGIDPTLVVDELAAQGLMTCTERPCTYAHPLVQGILARFLPRPVGVAEDDFYACLSCYADQIDLEVWSDADFAAEVASRIVEPGRRALDLLRAHPYLTRLFTTLSPHEMTRDPLFHANADLPDVSNVYTATLVNVCEGTSYIELEDGRKIAVDPSGTLPMDMPSAERVDEVPEQGAPMTVVDLEEDIEDARRSWNTQMGLDDGSGCNCRSRRRGWDGAAWMALVFGFAWVARRRR